MNNKFYLILALLLLLFTSCNDVNTSENKSNNDADNTKTKLTTVTSSQKDNNSNLTPAVPKKPKVVSKEYNFSFQDLNNNVSLLNVKNDVYHFTNIKQPIVMINLFSSWCPPCRGQIPHLTNLQKKFKKHFFVLSALVHDGITNKELEKFTIAEKALFFISKEQKENLKFAHMITPKLGLKKDFPLPLMIMFVNGKYFTHYEGIMPEEMIESDIKQLLQKINKQ